MKKAEQEEINGACEEFYELSMKEFKYNLPAKQLRSCNAWIYESENNLYLRSYNTIVAIYLKPLNVVIDVLRMVYGYTATSAQHISKFINDYCKTATRYTAR